MKTAFDTPLLLVHLLKCIRNIMSTNFFTVLKLEKLVSTVASHINEDIRTIIGKQSLRARYGGLHSTYASGVKSQKPQRGVYHAPVNSRITFSTVTS